MKYVSFALIFLLFGSGLRAMQEEEESDEFKFDLSLVEEHEELAPYVGSLSRNYINLAPDPKLKPLRSHSITLLSKKEHLCDEEQPVIKYKTKTKFASGKADWEAICLYYEQKKIELNYPSNHPYEVSSFKDKEKYLKIICYEIESQQIVASVFVDCKRFYFRGLAFETDKISLSTFLDDCKKLLKRKFKDKNFQKVLVRVGTHAFKYIAHLKKIEGSLECDNYTVVEGELLDGHEFETKAYIV